MTIDQALRAYLVSLSSVTAVVSTRVYCGDVPQSAALPAASISIVSAVHGHALRGKADYANCRLSVHVWADTHLETKTIGEVLRAALQGIGTTTMGTLTINDVVLSNEVDLYDPPLDGKAVGEYHLAQDYRIRFNEA